MRRSKWLKDDGAYYSGELAGKSENLASFKNLQEAEKKSVKHPELYFKYETSIGPIPYKYSLNDEENFLKRYDSFVNEIPFL